MVEQLIVVLVVGAVALAKWFFENAGRFQGGDEPEDAPQHPQPRPLQRPRNLAHPEESDEEKMRRFMEALGLPPESRPPPAPVRKPAAEPVVTKPRRSPSPVEPAKPRPVSQPVRPHIAPTLDTGGPLPEIPKTASVSETAPASEIVTIPQMVFASPEQLLERPQTRVESPSARRSSAASPRRQAGGATGSLKEQLRTPAALRNAILLREILGAPKGLQSTQTSTNFSPL